VRDEVTGMILTARREPRLLMARATLPDGWPVISVDGGRQLSTSGELSDWLDRPVELVSARIGPGTFENPRDVDNEDDWVSWQSPNGSFHDSSSCVSIVSTASLSGYEQQRFRINLIVDGADAGSDESMLQGRDATIGSVGFHMREPITRCIVVARAQPGIAADLGVLKRVIRERDNIMGIGAQAYREGTLAVGDVVHPLPD
jgi:uncharacterized protein YcbX